MATALPAVKKPKASKAKTVTKSASLAVVAGYVAMALAGQPVDLMSVIGTVSGFFR